MKKIFSSLTLILLIFGCKKEQLKEPPPTPNPVIAYRGYMDGDNRVIYTINVIDSAGLTTTMVYSNYNDQTANFPDYPAWSSDGTKLCFTLNSTDLYTLNISIVNGVVVGSGATKIGDGIALGGSYKQGKWRPGHNQIACVWKKTGDPDKIHMLPSAGGSPSILYTAANADWEITRDDIAFKSDGSNLAFSERQISTGFVFLKVLDIETTQVIKSINLSQFKLIREIDWAKSPGSNIVAITVWPICDNTIVGRNGIPQLYTIDVGSPAPTVTWLRDGVQNICWSSNDSQITIPIGNSSYGVTCNPMNNCCFTDYYNFCIYTIASGTYSPVSYTNFYNPDWRR